MKRQCASVFDGRKDYSISNPVKNPTYKTDYGYIWVAAIIFNNHETDPKGPRSSFRAYKNVVNSLYCQYQASAAEVGGPGGPWPLLNFKTLHRNSNFAIENHLSLVKWPP